MSEIIIQRLAENDAEGFAQAYRFIARPSQLSEQRPEDEFQEAQCCGRLPLSRRAAWRGRSVGLSVSYVPSEDYFWLFEYAAVAPEMRGKSIGAQLFRCAAVMIAGMHRTALIEVDADRGEPRNRRGG